MSQECSTLARTTVLSDTYSYYRGTVYHNTEDERETVDGDACTAHDWDAKFEPFCDYLGWIPGYDCGIPSAFNTTWNVDGATSDSRSAQSHFSCSNFPVIPDTVVSAHDVQMIGTGSVPDVEFEYTVGVVDEYDFSDYDPNQNGIVNLIKDGLSAYYDVDSVYSYGLAVYLLDHSDGVVF